MTTTTLTEIPISKLRARPDNLRTEANGDDLVDSLRSLGVLQPLNVTKDPEKDIFWVNAGHRRLDGAKKAGLKSVPALVIELDEAEVIATMIAENGQRRDLTIFEEARGFQALADLGKSQADIATLVGVSRPVVSKRLKLAALPGEIVNLIPEGTSAAMCELLADLYAAGADDETMVSHAHRPTDWSINRAIEQAKAESAIAKLGEKLARLDVRFIPPADVNRGAILDGEDVIRVDFGWVDVELDDDDDEPFLDTVVVTCGTGPLEIEAAMADENVVGMSVAKVDGKFQLAPVYRQVDAPTDTFTVNVDTDTGERTIERAPAPKPTKSDEEKLAARRQREQAKHRHEFLRSTAQSKPNADLLTHGTFLLATSVIQYGNARGICELLDIEPVEYTQGDKVQKDWHQAWRQALAAVETPAQQKRILWAITVYMSDYLTRDLLDDINERYGFEPLTFD